MTTAAPQPKAWLFGPAADVLLGAGIGYAVLIGLVAMVSMQSDTVQSWIPMIALALNVPHFGATLMRVYEHPAQRNKYRFFTLWITLALLILCFVSVRSVWLASLMYTVMLTWGPWHYAGQNFGLSMMFLRRGKVEISSLARRFLHASFVISAVLAVLPLHATMTTQNRAAVLPAAGGLGVKFLPLGLPIDAGRIAFIALGVAYVGCVIAAFTLLSRTTSRARLSVPAMLVASQGAWFTIPAVLQFGFGGMGTLLENPSMAFIWVATGHSVQYLWVTSYHARGATGAAEKPLPHFVKALLAGAIAWTFLPIVFAPNMLGKIPSDLGLAITIGTFINLHHFILDGAIWKLRDGPLARILIGNEVEKTTPGKPAPPFGRPAFLAVGLLALSLNVIGIWQRREAKEAYARRDLEALGRSQLMLSIIGDDTARLHIQLGELEHERGNLDAAEAEFLAANQLFENPMAYVELGRVREEKGKLGDALESYRLATKLDPENSVSLVREGIVYMKTRNYPSAKKAFTEAAARAPNDEVIKRYLADASAALAPPPAPAP